MGLFSLVVVLLIEQVRPLPYQRLIHGRLESFARLLERKLNAGEHSHGILAWGLAVLGALMLAGGAYALLQTISPFLAWIWTVTLLYLAMGYGQFSRTYSEIEMALRMDDLPEARRLLGPYHERSCDELSTQEVARVAIEKVFVTAHRHFFGVLFCFILLPGPCGAVLYRMAAFLANLWGRNEDADAGSFGKFSRQAFALIDWLPARLTATAFAVVGNFEDAMYCWRTRAARQTEREDDVAAGIVLSSAGGALGVRLGDSQPGPGETGEAAESCLLGDAGVDAMQGAVSMVWRAVVLCLLLLLLFRFARLVTA